MPRLWVIMGSTEMRTVSVQVDVRLLENGVSLRSQKSTHREPGDALIPDDEPEPEWRGCRLLES